MANFLDELFSSADPTNQNAARNQVPNKPTVVIPPPQQKGGQTTPPPDMRSTPPGGNVSNNIPEVVQQSIDNVSKMKTAAFDAQKQRQSDLLNSEQQAVQTVNSATTKIRNLQDMPFGLGGLISDIYGSFNPDYSIPKQIETVQNTRRDFHDKVVQDKIQTQKEQLGIQSAAQPYNNFVSKLNVQGKMLGLTAAELSLFSENRNAHLAYQGMVANQLPINQLRDMQKSGDFKQTGLDRGFVDSYLAKHDGAVMDAEKASLAFKKQATDVGDYLQQKAIDGMDSGYLTERLQVAEQSKNPGLVTLAEDSAHPLVIARDKVISAINQKHKIENQYATEQANLATKAVGQNGAVYKVLNDAATLSSLGAIGTQAQDVQSFRDMNKVNITSQTVADAPFGSLRYDLRGPIQNIVQKIADMNTPGAKNSLQDITELNNYIKTAQDSIDKIKENNIKNAPTSLKPAYQEFYDNNGRLINNKTAADVSAAGISSTPDFSGNGAWAKPLEEAYQGFQKILYKNTTGEHPDLYNPNMTGMQQLNALLASKVLKGKTPPEQDVYAAMQGTTANNNSPISLWTTGASEQIMRQALYSFAKDQAQSGNPQLTNLIVDPQGRVNEAFIQDPSKLVKVLALQSWNMTQSNSTLQPNKLNQELMGAINTAYVSAIPQWDKAYNVQSAAFIKNLFNNVSPLTSVQNAILMKFAEPAMSAWNELIQNNGQFTADVQHQQVLDQQQHNAQSTLNQMSHLNPGIFP